MTARIGASGGTTTRGTGAASVRFFSGVGRATERGDRGDAERGSSRESSERRAFPCATGAARGGECARATRPRRREARADECVAFREKRRCLGTDEKGSGEKTPEAARNERPEPDRARRRAGILTSPSLASRGNVTVYDSGNERSLSGRTDALEPGTTSQQRASPSRVDRTRAPRPRLARAFFAISTRFPARSYA